MPPAGYAEHCHLTIMLDDIGHRCTRQDHCERMLNNNDHCGQTVLRSRANIKTRMFDKEWCHNAACVRCMHTLHTCGQGHRMHQLLVIGLASLHWLQQFRLISFGPRHQIRCSNVSQACVMTPAGTPAGDCVQDVRGLWRPIRPEQCISGQGRTL